MIYFIGEKYIKENSVITDNVDVTDYTPLVQFSAKAWIKPMIGSYFFNYLLTKYNDETLSSDETNLVEFIKPAILWRLTGQACLTLSYQLKNKGLVQQNDENATSVDLQTTQFMYNHYIEHAKLYEKQLEDYLIANKDLYPEFLSDDNKDSSIKNKIKSCNRLDDGYNESLGFIMV